MENFLQKAKAVVLGHAIGDALGVPVEFKSREYLTENPITDMLGYGTYPVPKGTWSDDTSMSLCALESLSKGNIDYKDIMLNFGKWYYNGEFTPTGETFDIGGTCEKAITNYFKNKMPLPKCGGKDEFDNGNGSLMRIYPFTLFLIYKKHQQSSLDHIKIINDASALTHAHPRSKAACVLYSFILWELLENPCKQAVKNGIDKAFDNFQTDYEDLFSEVFGFSERLENLTAIPENLIESDGYVVNTLQAALWCLLTTDSYEKCVLKAVNLGYDNDTTAAVAGALAGALFGYDAIPEKWKQQLLKKDYIENLCDKAFK